MPDCTVIDGGPEGRDRIYAEQELRDRFKRLRPKCCEVFEGREAV
jgi:ubiquitin